MSERSLVSRVRNVVGAQVVDPFFALDLHFDSGELNLWTGEGELDSFPTGKTYIGTGTLLNISEIEETSEISARGCTITLSGVPTSILSLALSEPYQGRKAILHFGMRTGVTDGQYINLNFLTEYFQVDVEFMEIFSGFMDTMNISESGDTSTITLTIENKLVDLERVRTNRYNSGYQKSLYPNDRGFDFVEDLQDKEIIWGRNATTSN